VPRFFFKTLYFQPVDPLPVAEMSQSDNGKWLRKLPGYSGVYESCPWEIRKTSQAQ